LTIFDDVAIKYGKQRAEILDRVEIARRSMVPVSKRVLVNDQGTAHTLKVSREGLGPLNTWFGPVHHFTFSIDDKWAKYSVLVMANLSPSFFPIFKDTTDLLLRVDSGCETGQLFGDRTCECRDQLELGLEKIAERGEGIVINIPRQDGRGLGLPFKLATLRLQEDLQVDTIEASALLDPDGSRDTRTFAGVIGILKFFEIPSGTRIGLMSNNNKKLEIFTDNGYRGKLVPVVVPPTIYTLPHLKAKQAVFGHANLVQEHGKGQEPVSVVLTQLRSTASRRNSAVCCGLDPDFDKMPLVFQDSRSPEDGILEFLTRVVDLTLESVCSYKIQKAFFDQYADGHRVLAKLISHIKARDPETPVIVDCKIGDIENTMRAYLENIFRVLGADAVVLNPYMGSEVWEALKA
jgi:GTP cyclohydrolase II